MTVALEQLVEGMFDLVEQFAGKKKFKPIDLSKAMKEKFGDEWDRALCKQAIRELVDSGRCIYTYFGGTFLELPPREDAADGQ